MHRYAPAFFHSFLRHQSQIKGAVWILLFGKSTSLHTCKKSSQNGLGSLLTFSINIFNPNSTKCFARLRHCRPMVNYQLANAKMEI